MNRVRILLPRSITHNRAQVVKVHVGFIFDVIYMVDDFLHFSHTHDVENFASRAFHMEARKMKKRKFSNELQ
jgi:hypothetical protein